MWNVSQSFACTSDEAWALLGKPSLTPRQTRRLTFAALELASLDRAFDAVTRRAKDLKSDQVLAVNEARLLYEAAWQPTWDRIAEECTKAQAEAGTLPEGAQVAPFTGDDLAAMMSADQTDGDTEVV